VAETELPVVEVEGGWDAALEDRPRTSLERAALPGFLYSQRWFGGKARKLSLVRLIDQGRLPIDPPAFATVLEVGYDDGGERELYFVPLAVVAGADSAGPGAVARLTGPAGEAVLRDALTVEGVCSMLLAMVGEGRGFATRAGRVRGLATSAYQELRGDPDSTLPASRSPATSSNSLIFFGERLLLKVFRRLQPGINPEYEVGRFLTERARFDRTPKVAGALEYLRPGEETSTVGILEEVVPARGDGWSHALRELDGYYERATDGPPSAEPVGPYLEAAAILGKRTAEMHLALASDPHDPVFAPEPFTAADADAVRDEVLRQGRSALAVLARTVDKLPSDVVPAARRLLDEGPAALGRITGANLAVPAATRIRIHGDYHLGQVLCTDGDYVILDFEGEPTRPVAERRAKLSPVRDVAGMLRSYHYAAYAGLFAAAHGRADEVARLEPWADHWQREVSAAFLQTYRATADRTALLPQDPGDFATLLDAFMLGKAFFELAYELNNRPDWVRIPLQGVLGLIVK
jgi:maltose alpha-D-glucosyltransferase/alpha-amylase